MPKDPSVNKVLIIGSGPIVIGQAAEFDYAGTQACLACREEGVEVVLVNSNPATIQTDPDTADRVYIEPLNVESLASIIRKERPDGLIATMGGQTGLNLAVELERAGVLQECNVRVLGTSIYSIGLAEDRQVFADLMVERGQPVLPHTSVADIWRAREFAEEHGFPLVVRAPFCLGGTGSGHAANMEELEVLVEVGLRESPVNVVLLEQSVLGWAEVEYEVLRDAQDNAIIVCNMENLDPMGVHTGESIVVAPSQTLSDPDYHMLRTAALEIVRSLDVRGGCNCQFAFNQQTGEWAIIEVNPRLSRSSALASKATGYPIARVAAKIALGYTLAELRNDITGASVCAEPTLDYVVVKLPRWPFDKFRDVDKRIGMTMKSTGETMAIGRSFEEAFLKALRSLDIGSGADRLSTSEEWTQERIRHCLANPTHERPAAIYNALAGGWSVQEIAEVSHIHPWFIERFAAIREMEERCRHDRTGDTLEEAKRLGFSDEHLIELYGEIPWTENPQENVTPHSTFRTPHSNDPVQRNLRFREMRRARGVRPTYKMVDSCAGEFAAATPYFYSTYETEDEAEPLPGRKAIVLGSGPIRIGQGIEFDYSSVHAVEALQSAGVKAIVINNNPETVSTDYHLSDRLYFEPLTLEEVLNVVEHEQAGGELLGVVTQFGGQTALNLVQPLAQAGVPILGTQPDSISATEDRKRMAAVCEHLGIPVPRWQIAHNQEELEEFAPKIGFPVLVRPSYVLGGRGMRIIHSAPELGTYLRGLGPRLSKHPVLIDQFLEDAMEVDIDAASDGREICAVIMEQIEPAGVHSGDSSCVYPPQTLAPELQEQITEYTLRLARHLGVLGLLNVQYAIKDGVVYLLEANARASRTVPFASKASGLPLARIATRLILGEKLSEINVRAQMRSGAERPVRWQGRGQVSVKSVVFPFDKFPALSRVLGPEMQSTGEVMGIAPTFEEALRKAGIATAPARRADSSPADDEQAEALAG
jgi:carbamoyl-phosphate synthase large subunit